MHDKNVERNQRLDIKDTTLFHIIEADNLYNAVVSFCEKYDDEIKQLSSQNKLYFYQHSLIIFVYIFHKVCKTYLPVPVFS